MSRHSGSRGFTLIELLVVIAIIAILAAILFPVFARAREKARQTTCSSNLRQIAASIQMYVQDHEETMPGTASVWKAINSDPGVLICPTLGKGTPNGYGFNYSLGGTAMGDIPDPTAVILVADATTSANNLLTLPSTIDKRHTNQAIMASVDGHVSVGLPPVTLVNMNYDMTGNLAAGTLVQGTTGPLGAWTRWGYYRNPITTYPATSYDAGAGFPGGDAGGGGNFHDIKNDSTFGNPAPSLLVQQNSDGQGYESATRALVLPNGSALWAMTMDVCFEPTGTDRIEQWIDLLDGAGKRIIRVDNYDWNNTGYHSGINGAKDLWNNNTTAHSQTAVWGANAFRTIVFQGYNGKVGFSLNNTYTEYSVYDAGANVAGLSGVLFDVTCGYGNCKMYVDNFKFGVK